jgi:hypothetical protein
MREKYSEIMKLSSRNSRSKRIKTTPPVHRGIMPHALGATHVRVACETAILTRSRAS